MAAPQDIIFENITKSYGNQKVLANFSQTFEAAQSYCLMAPSGTGKTTLLKLLAGLEQPDQGKIQGLENKKISMVFQEDRLLESYTAVENIRFACGKNISIEEIQRLLEAFLGKTDFALPVNRYSGGMRRKVCLLRALLAPSDLLLLDEPFTGMDEDSRRMACQLIRTYRAGRTLILSSHDRQDAQLLEAQILSL